MDNATSARIRCASAACSYQGRQRSSSPAPEVLSLTGAATPGEGANASPGFVRRPWEETICVSGRTASRWAGKAAFLHRTRSYRRMARLVTTADSDIVTSWVMSVCSQERTL
jgi:hypothetical protein